MKFLLPFLMGLCTCVLLQAQSTYYVATTGSDATGDGSNANPWATITHALDNCTDGSTILVKPGTYNGRIRMRGSFSTGETVRSEVAYQAKLRNNDRVMTFYSDPAGCHGITVEGFDIAHDGAGAAALVIHIEGNGNGAVHDITFENNILHDSYNNDIAKINHSCYNIYIRRNLFYNQTGTDEHIDGNSVRNLVIEDNIFMNDFAASGRTNNNATSSYIVLKDSDNTDMYTGAQAIKVRRNVFLNYEGSTGTNFLLLGEDGNPYYEVWDVMIENNLMIGNSANQMRAPLGLKGARQVTFRNNTICGDLPANAFAFRFNTEGNNPNNDSVYIYNNSWSDPTGSMNDFSDTPLNETDLFELDNNLYWNNGTAIPSNTTNDLININDDLNAVTADPLLGAQSGLVTPHFDGQNFTFADGSTTIRQAFERLVSNYGTPGSGSAAIDAANAANAPVDDILGNLRAGSIDIGAVEVGAPSAVHKFANLNAQIFPNPTRDLLFIQLENAGTVDYQWIDLQGRVLEQGSFRGDTSLDVVDYAAGMYLLKLSSEQGVENFKVVVE